MDITPLNNDGWKTIRLPIGFFGQISGVNCETLVFLFFLHPFFVQPTRLVQGSHAATVISLEAGAGTLYGNVSSLGQQRRTGRVMQGNAIGKPGKCRIRGFS